MTIQATDLKLRASERMADDSSTVLGQGGGGRMGTAVISGAVENDVFPDVAPGDRTTGATRFRKVYLQVMSDENDWLLLHSAGSMSGVSPSASLATILFSRV